MPRHYAPRQPLTTTTCLTCGKTFPVFAADLRRGYRKYCCNGCRPSAETRFWAKVEKSSDPDGCWIWKGGNKGTNNHGVFWYNGRLDGAHRVSWQFNFGPIPDGIDVCHTCDVEPCVRPSHLFLGTQVENLADMRRKGRHAKGDRQGWYTKPERMVPPSSKLGHEAQRLHPECLARGERSHKSDLTDAKVIDMRERHAHGETNISHMAADFGVSRSTVRRILDRRSWTHI